ncbi:hypothetical protein DN388_16055 [Pseudomonas sp. S12(2018)]|uniref:hypothetical protein n=1 Tax=Pseudomonas sp. S12(2018) TaxID=2219664 RepID=UPI0020CD741E|nr:hypothetical protein [Pseudomonas sp. S12(2018)]MCQ0168471.1 hypothetical protein [Pseudomonas sp. S12(2018)]
MTDLLNIEKINALPQPIFAWLHGGWWPVHDIEVQTGMMRIDACGMLDVMCFSDALMIRDDAGQTHDTDDFYLEAGVGP